MHIAEAIKSLRKKNHFTQEQLAEVCNVSRQAIAKWESGANFPDIEKIIQLSELFNVSVDELLTGKAGVRPSSQAATAKADGSSNERIINEALRRAIACEDPWESVDQFISFIGEKVNCNRAYLFKADADGGYRLDCSWQNPDVAPQRVCAQHITPDEAAFWQDAFAHDGRVALEGTEGIVSAYPAAFRWLKRQGVRSHLALPVAQGRRIWGIDNSAPAFLEQTFSLMNESLCFVDSLVEQGEAFDAATWADMQKMQLAQPLEMLRFQMDASTGEAHFSEGRPEGAGYRFNVKSLTELEEFAAGHPEFREHLIIDGFQRIGEMNEGMTIEFVSCKDGAQIRWNKLSMRPVLSSTGIMTRLYGVLSDASAEHRIVELHNRCASERSTGLYVRCLSEPAHMEYVSDGLCALLGYNPNEFAQVVGEKYTSIIAEKDRVRYLGFIKRLGEKPGVEACEYALQKKDGSFVRVVDTMESVLDGSGVVYGYASVIEKPASGVLQEAHGQSAQVLAPINMQYEVMNQLGQDYLNVFRVWLDADKAQIIQLNGYVTKGMNEGSAEYIPYYRFCKQYVHDRVHRDDKQKMLNAMHPDTVRKALAQGSEYTVVYRIEDGGETHFYQLRYVPLNDQPEGGEAQFIAGFRNVDKVMEEEHAKTQRLQDELDVIKIILQAFTNGYLIDYQNNTFVELACNNADITRIVGTGGSYVEDFDKLKLAFPDEKAFKAIREFLRQDTLKERLNGHRFLSSQVFIKGFGWYDLYLLVLDYDENGLVHRLVYATRDVTEEKAREEEQKKLNGTKASEESK